MSCYLLENWWTVGESNSRLMRARQPLSRLTNSPLKPFSVAFNRGNLFRLLKLGRANRIRTDVSTLKGCHPRPLDDNSTEILSLHFFQLNTHAVCIEHKLGSVGGI